MKIITHVVTDGMNRMDEVEVSDKLFGLSLTLVLSTGEWRVVVAEGLCSNDDFGSSEAHPQPTPETSPEGT